MDASEPVPGSLPPVTVVVPVKDGAADLARLLPSLAALDYPRDRLEVLVVDNGSSDGTAEVARRLGVPVLSETAVRSSYAARNRGAAAARGEWIAFTDADCVATPDWLRRLLAPPLPPDVGAVVGEVEAFEAETAVQRLTERFGLMRHAVTLPHKALPCFSTANVAVRKDALARLGGFREDVRFFGDMDLSWRLQLQLGARLLFRPEARILHRHRRGVEALWRQGVQHGRGVAFMKKTFPEHYRIHPLEQVRRLGGIARAAGGALAPSTRGAGPAGDRFWAPVFLCVWYGGMLLGYLRGPAWTPGRKGEVG
jgi:cellulose synthase/poly-beta-1,6-N-acetylglucosamine synthase-like glycosyltransferase